MKCQHCEAEVYLPFKCPFCNNYFCAEHRLPEMHYCPELRKISEKADLRRSFEEAPNEGKYRFENHLQQSKIRLFGFSFIEMKHLTIGTLIVIGVGLSIFLRMFQILRFSPDVVISSLAVFTAMFILHEIAHKIIAQHHGLWAEFRLTLLGSLITVLSIFFPIKVISPGVVQIVGVADKEVIGRASLAGPAVNLIFSAIFLPLHYHLQTFSTFVGATLNPWWALLNLIPFSIFDGEKIFWWSKKVWTFCFTVSLILTILAYRLFLPPGFYL